MSMCVKRVKWYQRPGGKTSHHLYCKKGHYTWAGTTPTLLQFPLEERFLLNIYRFFLFHMCSLFQKRKTKEQFVSEEMKHSSKPTTSNYTNVGELYDQFCD